MILCNVFVCLIEVVISSILRISASISQLSAAIIIFVRESSPIARHPELFYCDQCSLSLSVQLFLIRVIRLSWKLFSNFHMIFRTFPLCSLFRWHIRVGPECDRDFFDSMRLKRFVDAKPRVRGLCCRFQRDVRFFRTLSSDCRNSR